ncbi:MAG TPA: glycosyltransferase [Candidatus Eremiobacteraceae bacterium]|nr:glycosyltransferase [Candidatus Eremiobacteraceae bacterium]
MPSFPGIVAHLIIGSKPEPYLEAALASIGLVCEHLVVNDNSGDAQSPHAKTLSECALAAREAMTVVRTEFTTFSAARNACIDATPTRFNQSWALFFDADEVHGGELPAIADLLARLPSDVDAVDGYSRHFVGSFKWWSNIARRLCFFRLSPERRWSGAVHEQLLPSAKRWVVPELWHHYGHVMPPRREWEKGRLYNSLGQSGFVASDEQMRNVSPADVWGHLLPEILPYRGEYPGPARATIARLSAQWAETFTEVDALFSRRAHIWRLRGWIRRLNFDRLLAMRRLESSLRRNLAG